MTPAVSHSLPQSQNYLSCEWSGSNFVHLSHWTDGGESEFRDEKKWFPQGHIAN